MVARAYGDLGGIGGEQENRPEDYSPRGKDQDRIQTFVFECDSTDPLTALLHLQGSNDAPLNTTPDEDRIWTDLLSMNVIAEPGIFFVETSIEIAQVRLVCKTGNYTSGRLLRARTMR
jgi:hypothetical protein